MGRVENTQPLFSKVILLTGPREVGKTRLLLKILEEFKDGELQITGVVSPAAFSGRDKTAIALMDVRNKGSQKGWPSFGRWIHLSDD